MSVPSHLSRCLPGSFDRLVEERAVNKAWNLKEKYRHTNGSGFVKSKKMTDGQLITNKVI